MSGDSVITNSFAVDVAAGRWGHVSSNHKFGRNSAVATSEVVIWEGGTHTFLQAASAVRVAAGGNAADTAAGAGAQSVTIQGLDGNLEVAEETVATAGASASAATTTTFLRVFRAFVAGVGTYGAANTAAITIETTGGTTMALISADLGQTQMAVYTVPAGHTAYVSRLDVNVDDGNRTVDAFFYQRRNADTIAAPMGAKRLVEAFPGLPTGTGRVVEYDAPLVFPEKTDLYVTAVVSTGTAAVTSTFDYVLVNNRRTP